MTLRCGKHLEEEAARQQLGEFRANLREKKKEKAIEEANMDKNLNESSDDLIPGS